MSKLVKPIIAASVAMFVFKLALDFLNGLAEPIYDCSKHDEATELGYDLA